MCWYVKNQWKGGILTIFGEFTTSTASLRVRSLVRKLSSSSTIDSRQYRTAMWRAFSPFWTNKKTSSQKWMECNIFKKTIVIKISYEFYLKNSWANFKQFSWYFWASTVAIKRQIVFFFRTFVTSGIFFSSIIYLYESISPSGFGFALKMLQ